VSSNARRDEPVSYVNDDDILLATAVHDVNIDGTVVHDVIDTVESDPQPESFSCNGDTVVRRKCGALQTDLLRNNTFN